MNKKRLSVVMAGAMLASSVAPVLAATETVVNESERGLLIKRLRELVSGTVFSNIEENKKQSEDANGNHDNPGQSVYYIKVVDAKGNKVDNYTLANLADLEKDLQNEKKIPAGSKLSVYDRGHIVKDGVVYNHALETVQEAVTYTTPDLEKVYNDFKGGKNAQKYSDVIYKMSFEDGILKVTCRTAPTESEYKVLEYKAGSNKVKFNRPMDVNGNVLVKDKDGEWPTFDHFEEEKKVSVTEGKNIPTKLIETITLTDEDAKYETVLSKLYDGLFLKEDGQKLLEALKEYDANVDKKYKTTISTIEKNGRGLYELTIKFEKTINKETIKQTLVITTNDKDKLEFFKDGIASKKTPGHKTLYRKFPVQKLEGTDRHETAVKVARENADIKTVAENGNIVLVNSDSLVDGLAAAPLAASVINQDNTIAKDKNYVAPILLTNRDGLDKVTKDYIKEVVAHQRVGALDKVTVYLVGGEAVISESVENDLEEAGLRVVRAGGKDREATSLRVAELIEKDTNEDIEKAFLVGATGEADAMSIASYAADSRTPIIVESVHGISKTAVDYLKGYKVDAGKDVTIVGGEKAVSTATEETLKSEKVKVERLAGANRKATNAKVISTLYKNHSLTDILVSKDGIARKGELIDALTATSIAAKYHSPIVLATDSITKEQLNALELKATREKTKYVYQIGGNVSESVVRTIADRLNLAR
ncbi:cell wall-binding repeat-containing protein [Peptoclostridium sp. AF21-18]|uniref:cell wall-binding repeat-containing protein n=1 Tax=Peptoclostridium sp. AF21-18 TaxID=2292243 RepID=UPI000E505887|nr:cell wall-binding repeat-containing protein [Peptoclostridium sp. AF21-18]RHQ97501.1 cell wall-binding repeat-containing protein [Peptoclostridium sp. AF21-18]